MQHSLRRRAVVAAVALSVGAFGSIIGSTSASADKTTAPGQTMPAERPDAPPVVESTSGSYIVLLQSDPLIAEFGQEGLDTSDARTQAKELTDEQDELMAEVGIDADDQLASYTNALNGFAAIMTFAQAEQLSTKAGVSAVFPNELQQPTTDASGDFLGLSGDSGVWATEATGNGVLVGVIDSGIWPEHPSLDPAGFAGDAVHGPLGTYVDTDGDGNVLGEYNGCEFGTTTHELADGFYDDPFACNAKLIGARQVMPAYEALTGLGPVEYDSARDEDGHGTHTATTAAGNAGVTASVFEVERGTVSGVAPDAQVAVYKALGELGGYGSDLALAIDIAVADGVDVINYSIGSSSFAIGPDDVAFFFAALDGVHVATSNGNSGPGAATIGSPASVPWLTSVGASTHDRTFLGAVKLTQTKRWNPRSHHGWWGRWRHHHQPKPIVLEGVSITAGTSELEIVDAADYGNELCLSDVPFVSTKNNGHSSSKSKASERWGHHKKDTIEGKIVLCKRGENARIDKSYAVYLGGGAGMVLYNTFDADTQITDSHWVPSVHLNFTDGSAVKEYIATTKDPKARIKGGEKAETQGSVMAAFSSRGENLLSGDLIKPDVTAPGVNILAGATPTPTSGPAGNLFQSISGTSMSSPHVAGLMALLTEVHPDWSPAMVKSALMTTARQDVTKEDGVTAADPFDMGAGHVVPQSMFDPGLVYDVGNYYGVYEYVGAMCGAGIDLFGLCSSTEPAGLNDLSNYNQASIASAAVPGSQSLVRTVTNVSGSDLTLTPSFGGLAGISASMEPATLVVPAGGTVDYEVTFVNTSAPVNEWAFGSLTLEGGGYSVYSPIALRPVTLGVPYEVGAAIADGGASFAVEFGYTGDYLAQGHGLVAADLRNDTVDQDPGSEFDPSDVGNGATAHTVDVAAGTAVLRVHIPPVANPDTDLDLYVYDPAGNLVALSGNGGTDETVDISAPEAGQWTFYVHGWAAGPDTAYVAEVYQISATPGGDMVVDAPVTSTLGTTGTVTATWSTELPAGPYLGAVSHTTPDGLDSLTLISVSG